jgi:lipopolysaccharide transport system ATP-binding protein
MSVPVITIERLSKMYRLGAIGSSSLHEDVSRAWARLRGKDDPTAPLEPTNRVTRRGEFWALQDVSFDVHDGEALGIVGHNGAGKSTLLKVLSQVTAPTSGRAVIRGRVASLLEVGTGFHPDLSGRENVFLNGAIMGMSKAEIRLKFDEIVAFSGCEQFIDTPVKRYSSGMYVRLAFAVAAHLEPEILIVDEVLAVGDAQFQKKCLGKMGEVSRGGRTVLFVSHNMVAIQSLCRRAILLQGGQMALEGPASAVVSDYLRGIHRTNQLTRWSLTDALGSEELHIKEIRITPQKPRPDGLIDTTTDIQVETEFWILKNHVQLHIAYVLINDEGVVVLATGSPPKRRAAGVYRSSFVLPGHLLNSGDYSLRLMIFRDESNLAFQRDAIASFSVIDDMKRDYAWFGRTPGAVQPPLPWTVERLPIDGENDLEAALAFAAESPDAVRDV